MKTPLIGCSSYDVLHIHKSLNKSCEKSVLVVKLVQSIIVSRVRFQDDVSKQMMDTLRKPQINYQNVASCINPSEDVLMT